MLRRRLAIREAPPARTGPALGGGSGGRARGYGRRAAGALATAATAVLSGAFAGTGDDAGAQPVEREGPVTWGVSPATPEGPDARAAFVYSVDPGGRVDDFVAVSNFSEQPIDLAVYASDAFNTTEGAFALRAADQAPTGAGAWVALATREVTVPGRSRVIVPFRLSVPGSATPGDHAAGIVASLLTPGTGGVGVAVDRRVGGRVHVRVAGELRPSLAVEGLHVSYRGGLNPLDGRAVVRYTVTNTGNVILGGQAQVHAAGPLGVLARRAEGGAVPELLPGQSFRASATVRAVPATVRVAAGARVEPAAPGGQFLDPPPAPAEAGAHARAVPWSVLALLAAASATAGVRAARRRPSPPGAPASPRPPVPAGEPALEETR
ncbi:MAG: DUF916 domain-containing protein [Acidimicrobiia bacterium]